MKKDGGTGDQSLVQRRRKEQKMKACTEAQNMNSSLQFSLESKVKVTMLWHPQLGMLWWQQGSGLSSGTFPFPLLLAAVSPYLEMSMALQSYWAITSASYT